MSEERRSSAVWEVVFMKVLCSSTFTRGEHLRSQAEYPRALRTGVFFRCSRIYEEAETTTRRYGPCCVTGHYKHGERHVESCLLYCQVRASSERDRRQTEGDGLFRRRHLGAVPGSIRHEGFRL